MTGTKFDLDKARRFYQDDEEEEAVAVIDELLGIQGMGYEDALEKLRLWSTYIQRPDTPPVFHELPDDSRHVSISKGYEASLSEWGFAGLYDAMMLRSLSFSAILLGDGKKQKEANFFKSIENAKLVSTIFHELVELQIAKLWCIAGQAPIVSIDPEWVVMSMDMHFEAIKKYPELAQAANIRHFFATTMAQAAAYHQDCFEVQEKWTMLSKVMSEKHLPPLQQLPFGLGWLGNILRR